MEITYGDIKRRYAEATDDELLLIYVTADLEPHISDLLNNEIQNRGLDVSDIEQAVKTENYLADERKITHDKFHRWFMLSSVFTGITIAIIIIKFLWRLISQ
jgi:hypothetical protein